MAVPSPKYTGARFFNSSSHLSSLLDASVSNQVFVDVGGKADSGFRAAAVGLIDHFSSHPRGQGEWITKVLAAHFSYFPQHEPKLPGLVTSAERMQQLSKQVNPCELITALAYTLRQLAVNELCSHPVRYRRTFSEMNDMVSPKDLREPTTWISDGIAALAHALEFPFEVNVVERVKTLPMRLQYGHDLSARNPSPVVLQLENQHYKVCVASSERFSAVRTFPDRELRPITSELMQDPTREELHKMITVEDERLAQVFDDHYHRLAVMVAAGELNKESLLTMYVKGIADHSALTNQVVGVEHGQQRFFDMILNGKQLSEQQCLSWSGGKPLQPLVHELIRTIAGSITLGQMRAEHVFSCMDETQERGASSKRPLA